MEQEEKRLEQFRQLRKEIRGTQNYLVVGIDISKDIQRIYENHLGQDVVPRVDL
jgi:hypothetical protein